MILWVGPFVHRVPHLDVKVVGEYSFKSAYLSSLNMVRGAFVLCHAGILILRREAGYFASCDGYKWDTGKFPENRICPAISGHLATLIVF